MAVKKLTPEERIARGKRLVMYGMFALVLITFVATFLVLGIVAKNVGGAAVNAVSVALGPSLLIAGIALVACVIGWFVYTRVLLK